MGSLIRTTLGSLVLSRVKYRRGARPSALRAVLGTAPPARQPREKPRDNMDEIHGGVRIPFRPALHPGASTMARGMSTGCAGADRLAWSGGARWRPGHGHLWGGAGTYLVENGHNAVDLLVSEDHVRPLGGIVGEGGLVESRNFHDTVGGQMLHDELDEPELVPRSGPSPGSGGGRQSARTRSCHTPHEPTATWRAEPAATEDPSGARRGRRSRISGGRRRRRCAGGHYWVCPYWIRR